MDNIKDVATTILDQLGGRKFIDMTGSKNFLADRDRLLMTLAKNRSKANRLEIRLNGLDLYDMRFFQYISFKFNVSNRSTREEKIEDIKTYKNVYCHQLQELFTSVTGMYTSL
jgi:hypothetical protein